MALSKTQIGSLTVGQSTVGDQTSAALSKIATCKHCAALRQGVALVSAALLEIAICKLSAERGRERKRKVGSVASSKTLIGKHTVEQSMAWNQVNVGSSKTATYKHCVALKLAGGLANADSLKITTNKLNAEPNRNRFHHEIAADLRDHRSN